MVKQGIATSGAAIILFLLVFAGPAFPSVITIRTGEDASSDVQIVCERVVVSANDSGEAIFAGGDLRYCNQPGEPQIPWKVMDVLLPPNAELATVAAQVQVSYDMVEGVWNVGPTPTPTTWIDGREIVDLPTDKNIEDGYDLDIYRADAFWPQPRARLLGAGRIHNFRLAKVAVPLVRCNPTTGQLLSLAKANVSVTFSREKNQAAAQFAKHGRFRVKKLAVNFAAAAGEYGDDDGDVVGDMSSLDNSEGEILPADLESTGYTIITTAAIQSASTKLNSFVAHKEARGFTVKVVTEGATADATHYLTGSTADERADNVRTWLKNNYIADDTLYVLFIGNPHPETFNTSQSVPMKMLWPRSDSDEYRDAPSDFYFCDLTGNWDLDGDGLSGEGVGDFGAGGVDKYWEVLVGRIPYYGIIADTDAILQKTIDYENAEDVNWRRNVLIAMVPLSEGTFSYDLGEKIKYDLLEPEGIASTRVYRDGYGFTPSPSYHCSRDYPATVWSQNEFGLIVWLTHGWSQGASSVMTSDDAVNLNDSYPGTTWQGSCTNSQPEDDYNLAYAILKNGGIGSLGASRVSWYSSATNMDSVGGMGYQYALRVLARQSCGDSLCDLRQDGYGYWANCCVFNLYGDPSVIVMGPTPAFTITPTDAVYMPGAEGLIGSASRTFTLNNNSSGRMAMPLDWTASHDGTWFNLSSYGGTINPQD
ncbi:MAG TPA: C25 family cysteine peptidase, partial [Sedimentisphaerales bacterium]|nr:C25 family cysteine peptidase [Sedimentisphaerales bacterium]